MKKIILILLFASSMMYAKDYKVVFDLMTSSECKLNKALIKNVEKLRTYYKKNGDTLKVAVVISGGSYKFFVKDLNNSPYNHDKDLKHTFYKRSSMLTKFSKNVNIEVCSMGMAKRGIKPEVLQDFVVPAFNKTDALIRYQNDGYAYIPIK